MIDFWEMMGRMVTDQNLLNILVNLPIVNYQVGQDHRAAIPPADYTALRGKVAPFMPAKPLSLMALGEMLFALTIPAFRTNAGVVATKLAALHLPQPQNDKFYVALGAMIVDDRLRVELVDNGHWTKWGFDYVDPIDRQTLSAALDLGQNPIPVKAIQNFCLTGWSHDCNDLVIEWAGHTHPVTV
jgi:hypothetical protein